MVPTNSFLMTVVFPLTMGVSVCQWSFQTSWWYIALHFVAETVNFSLKVENCGIKVWWYELPQ
jgi:hypothetical protein